MQNRLNATQLFVLERSFDGVTSEDVHDLSGKKEAYEKAVSGILYGDRPTQLDLS